MAEIREHTAELPVSPTSVPGGTSTTRTVFLSSAAPAGGASVTLATSSSAGQASRRPDLRFLHHHHRRAAIEHPGRRHGIPGQRIAIGQFHRDSRKSDFRADSLVALAWPHKRCRWQFLTGNCHAQ